MHFGMLFVKTISLSAAGCVLIAVKVTGLTQLLTANNMRHVWSLMQLRDQLSIAQYREQLGKAGQ